jgi:hypothetical protein
LLEVVLVSQWDVVCTEFDLAEFELLHAAAEVEVLNRCAVKLGGPQLPTSPGQERAH